jgi:hypothetical protein
LEKIGLLPLRLATLGMIEFDNVRVHALRPFSPLSLRMFCDTGEALERACNLLLQNVSVQKVMPDQKFARTKKQDYQNSDSTSSNGLSEKSPTTKIMVLQSTSIPILGPFALVVAEKLQGKVLKHNSMSALLRVPISTSAVTIGGVCH